jgi:hypothetical protein
MKKVLPGLANLLVGLWCLGALRSKTEAEYVAAGACCVQLLWMKQTLKDYGCELTKIPLLCDNESAIKMANNPINHS